jgi:hypothetical protein
MKKFRDFARKDTIRSSMIYFEKRTLISVCKFSRFGHDWDPNCMKMDESLFAIAEKVNKNLHFHTNNIISRFFCAADI